MSSAVRQAFVNNICARPADDTPRLVFADWLDEHGDPDRAEFIRGQIHLDTLHEWDDGFTELDIRCRELLRLHADEWLGGLARFVTDAELADREWPVFRRGFVDRLTLSHRTFADYADVLFRGCPLAGVRLTGPGLPRGRSLFGPHLRRLTAIGLVDYPGFVFPPWEWDDYENMQTNIAGICPAGVRELWLDSSMPSGTEVWEQIAAAAFADRLETLTIRRRTGAEYELAPLHRLPALRRLAVAGTIPITPAAAWFHSLTHLSVTSFDGISGAPEAIPRMPELQSLRFVGGAAATAVERFAATEAATFWQELSVTHAGGYVARPLLRHPAASMVGVLDLSDNPAAAAVVLGEAGDLPARDTLRVLRLNGCGTAAAGLNRFVAGRGLPNLVRLELGAGETGIASGVAVPDVRWLLDGGTAPKLVALRVSGPAAAIEAVAECAGAARLRELAFDGEMTLAAAKVLAASRHLDGLGLLDVVTDDRGATDVLRRRFGRRLRVTAV